MMIVSITEMLSFVQIIYICIIAVFEITDKLLGHYISAKNVLPQNCCCLNMSEYV